VKAKLHIGRLILEGLPLSSHDEPRVRAELTAELQRLIAAGGLSHELRVGGAIPAVRGGTLEISRESGPQGLGRQIAQSVYGGLGKPE